MARKKQSTQKERERVEVMNDWETLEVTVDNLERIVEDITLDCCLETESNPYDIPPSIWNYTLLTIKERVFENNLDMLKIPGSIGQEYDDEKVLRVYEAYKKLCLKHKQQISVGGFIYMTGISRQVIYNWNADSKYNSISRGSKATGLNKKLIDFAKQISIDNEESLEALLLDHSINPVKPLAILNRNHQWNMPGVTRETAPKQVLTADQLPQLGDKNMCKNDQIEEKNIPYLGFEKDAQKQAVELDKMNENT